MEQVLVWPPALVWAGGFAFQGKAECGPGRCRRLPERIYWGRRWKTVSV